MFDKFKSIIKVKLKPLFLPPKYIRDLIACAYQQFFGNFIFKRLSFQSDICPTMGFPGGSEGRESAYN